jgi:hypothetical protein
MKKILSFAVTGIAIMLMSSCAMTSRTGVVAPFAYNEVHPNEIRAEVNFDGVNKVEGKAKQWYLGFIRISGGNKYFEDRNTRPSLFGNRIKKAQSCAMYDAMEKGQCDIIANPQYKNVTHRWLFGLIKRYDVTVTGYGGKITKLYQHTEPTPYQSVPLR